MPQVLGYSGGMCAGLSLAVSDFLQSLFHTFSNSHKFREVFVKLAWNLACFFTRQPWPFLQSPCVCIGGGGFVYHFEALV